MLEEARGILALRPDLGVLGEAVEQLELEVTAMPVAHAGGSSGLTPAELRLLPHLSTHLSFREIGERLHVSRNTVKTQAISVYRKLGVSSRSEAVAVAQDIGLVEAAEPKEDREPSETVGSLAL
jgi:LuxR family maltose regulon positive regulatory protein